MKLKSTLITLTTLILIPLVSAFDYPDIFDNEWVRFGIIFAILFGLLYSFLITKFNDSSAPTTIVSAGLSILLTMAIAKRDLLDMFLEEGIVDWIVIGAIIILTLVLIIYLWKKLPGGKAKLGIILGLLFVLGLIPYFLKDYLPESLLYGPLGNFIEIVQELPAFIIWIALTIFIVFIILRLKEKVKNRGRGNYGQRVPRRWTRNRNYGQRTGRGWGRGRQRGRQRRTRGNVSRFGMPKLNRRQVRRNARQARPKTPKVESDRKKAKRLNKKYEKEKEAQKKANEEAAKAQKERGAKKQETEGEKARIRRITANSQRDFYTTKSISQLNAVYRREYKRISPRNYKDSGLKSYAKAYIGILKKRYKEQHNIITRKEKEWPKNRAKAAKGSREQARKDYEGKGDEKLNKGKQNIRSIIRSASSRMNSSTNQRDLNYVYKMAFNSLKPRNYKHNPKLQSFAKSALRSLKAVYNKNLKRVRKEKVEQQGTVPEIKGFAAHKKRNPKLLESDNIKKMDSDLKKGIKQLSHARNLNELELAYRKWASALSMKKQKDIGMANFAAKAMGKLNRLFFKLRDNFEKQEQKNKKKLLLETEAAQKERIKRGKELKKLRNELTSLYKEYKETKRRGGNYKRLEIIKLNIEDKTKRIKALTNSSGRLN